MRKLLALGIVLWSGALSYACIGDVGDCDKDPTADCFKGKGTGGGSTTTTAVGGNLPCEKQGTCTLPLGSKCPAVGIPAKCQSGFCVDGVCCESQCQGKCMACSKAAAGTPGAVDGKCVPILSGKNDVDHPECNNKGGCGIAAGFCGCEDGQQNGNETDVDCGAECGGTCTLGQRCQSIKDCAPGTLCVDGVCCGNACTGPCLSCNQKGLEGVCAPTAGVDPGLCAAANACNPHDGCLLANGQICDKDPACASGLCKTAVCTACSLPDSPCSTGTCVGGSCIPTGEDLGVDCTGPDQCKSGFCMDGLCCDKACKGTCTSCRSAYTGKNDGTCAAILPGLDPHAACTGPGKMGTCSGSPPAANGNSPCGTN